MQVPTCACFFIAPKVTLLLHFTVCARLVYILLTHSSRPQNHSAQVP